MKPHDKIFLAAKRDYKYQCKTAKRKYTQKIAKDLEKMRNTKLREFWKTFRQKQKKYNDSEINISEFFEHFKNLSSKLDVSEDEECN